MKKIIIPIIIIFIISMISILTITNKNKDLQVIYNGIKEEDNSQIVDLNSTIPFLYVVKKKLVKLQPKTILNSILRFFEYQFNAPKQFTVCNYNN